MELVEGEPITRYCESRRLSVEERLRLFGTVCDAVQHAHRALVVHRDLKPANILVTAEGKPKLLDFGIGKLLAGAAGAADNIIQTAVGRRLMTPEYAAPEQFAGGPASTSMDIYALGVVLCELLVGRRPTGRRAAAPTRPSALVAADGSEEVARARGLSPQALERRLAGDLDTIVVTALRGDPKRRYPSVQALADDIELHLNGQPVAAGTAGEAPASSGTGDWGSPRSSSSP
jgi:serine/threonine protein kinase